MMPRSVEDEASPFNECTHAYLATDREILLQIVKAGDRVEDARILKERISLDMLADADALMGCQYSAESFPNTASTVYPDPLGIPFHAPTALTIFALVLGIWGLVQGIRVVERRIEASPTAPTATMRDGSPVDRRSLIGSPRRLRGQSKPGHMTEKRQGSVLRAFVAAGLAYVLVLHAVLSATSLARMSLSFGPILPPSTSSAPARVTARPGHPCRPMASATHPVPFALWAIAAHPCRRPPSPRLRAHQFASKASPSARSHSLCHGARRIVAAARTTHRGVISGATPRPIRPETDRP